MLSRRWPVVIGIVLLAVLVGLSIALLWRATNFTDQLQFDGRFDSNDDLRPKPQATAAPPRPIRIGETISDSFGPGDGPMAFSFTGDAGNQITITMISSKDNETPIDPAVQLLDGSGKVIAQSDDSLDPAFGLTNARLVRFPLPANGDYTILAMRSSDVDGGFTLTLKGTKTATVNKVTTVEYGKSVQGTVAADALRVSFQMAGTQGDVISINVQGQADGNLLPYVLLLGPDGDTLVTSDPNNKTSKTSKITRFLLRDDGTYTVVVTRIGEQSGKTTGSFRLTVSLVAQNTILNYGDTAKGTIDDQTSEVNFIFTATKGDTITIIMKHTDGDLISTLKLLGPDGKQVATSTASSNAGLKAGDAQIKRFRVGATGNFTIVAGRKDGDAGTTGGPFTLELALNKSTT